MWHPAELCGIRQIMWHPADYAAFGRTMWQLAELCGNRQNYGQPAELCGNRQNYVATGRTMWLHGLEAIILYSFDAIRCLESSKQILGSLFFF